MPGDILGSNLFNFQTSQFTLTRGPIFHELLLADEINRTPPKTQAALLEAMQERRVTLDGEIHPLSDRFMVVATQNPIESQGVYPLPEAQLDRFLFKVLPYPSFEEEARIVPAMARARGRRSPPIWACGRRRGRCAPPPPPSAGDAGRHDRRRCGWCAPRATAPIWWPAPARAPPCCWPAPAPCALDGRDM
jgi:hypothetical protein